MKRQRKKRTLKANPRASWLKIRCTPGEIEAIRVAADRILIDVSKFVRGAILSRIEEGK